MTDVKALNHGTVPLNEVHCFKAYLKRVFVIRKNSETRVVKIVKVRGSKVQIVSAEGNRQDSKTISTAEFIRYYELLGVADKEPGIVPEQVIPETNLIPPAAPTGSTFALKEATRLV